MLKLFKEFTLHIGFKMVYWNPQNLGSFKYDSNRAAKYDPGSRFGAFIIRNVEGSVVCVEFRRFDESISLKAMFLGLRFGLEYYISRNYYLLI